MHGHSFSVFNVQTGSKRSKSTLDTLLQINLKGKRDPFKTAILYKRCYMAFHVNLGTGMYRAPKDHINIRILANMISGIPLILSPRTRM